MGAVISAPFKGLWVGPCLYSRINRRRRKEKIDPFHLTLDEAKVADALSKRVLVTIDKKTGVTTLEVTMQDPLISASLTDTVMHCLQNYITNYRTNKAHMAKIQNISEIHPTLGFTEFDILEKIPQEF